MADVLVSAEWVAEHLSDEGVALVDVRPPFFYSQGHLPGAANLPAFYLSDPAGGPPDAADIARRLGEIGVSPQSHVVAYDDGAGTGAGRLFWVLTLYGHPTVSILDGGITKWRHDGRDWEYAPASTLPTGYAVTESETVRDVAVDSAGVIAALGTPDTLIVDVRSPSEYLGLQITAERDGHIPGAINIDWSNNLRRSDGTFYEFRPEEELRTLYETASATPDKRVVVYCQTGQRASVTFAILRALGYPDVTVYSPGWSEWGNREDTPVELS